MWGCGDRVGGEGGGVEVEVWRWRCGGEDGGEDGGDGGGGGEGGGEGGCVEVRVEW